MKLKDIVLIILTVNFIIGFCFSKPNSIPENVTRIFNEVGKENVSDSRFVSDWKTFRNSLRTPKEISKLIRIVDNQKGLKSYQLYKKLNDKRLVETFAVYTDNFDKVRGAFNVFKRSKLVKGHYRDSDVSKLVIKQGIKKTAKFVKLLYPQANRNIFYCGFYGSKLFGDLYFHFNRKYKGFFMVRDFVQINLERNTLNILGFAANITSRKPLFKIRIDEKTSGAAARDWAGKRMDCVRNKYCPKNERADARTYQINQVESMGLYFIENNIVAITDRGDVEWRKVDRDKCKYQLTYCYKVGISNDKYEIFDDDYFVIYVSAGNGKIVNVSNEMDKQKFFPQIGKKQKNEMQIPESEIGQKTLIENKSEPANKKDKK